MTRRAAQLVVLGALMVACGSSASVEDHLGDVDSILRIMQRESVAALPDPGIITADGVAGVNTARRTALDSLTDLVPPPEVAPEHTALVTTLGDLVVATDEFLAATAGLSADDFAAAVLTAAELDAFVGRVAAACQSLEDRAADLGHDFTC